VAKAKKTAALPPDEALGEILPIFDLPGHLIRRLHQIAVSIFLDGTRDFAITPVQYSALTAIRFMPGIDQRRLAKVIAFDRSTIGDVVIRLEKKGLVSRRKSASDKRTNELLISKKGEKLLGQMADAVQKTNAAITERLAPGESAAFMALLRKLVEINSDKSRVPFEPRAAERERLGRNGD
jgi:DNA-binding MarR family transcriptional regulator